MLCSFPKWRSRPTLSKFWSLNNHIRRYVNFYIIQGRRATDFETPKLWRVGRDISSSPSVRTLHWQFLAGERISWVFCWKIYSVGNGREITECVGFGILFTSPYLYAIEFEAPITVGTDINSFSDRLAFSEGTIQENHSLNIYVLRWITYKGPPS